MPSLRRLLACFVTCLCGCAVAAPTTGANGSRVFTTCWLMWEGPNDLGYTYTFNQNRRALDIMLEQRHPNMTIESYAATNVGSMTSDQANATVFDFIQNKRCNVILSADTYLLPYEYYLDGGMWLARQYPNVSFILIDDYRMPTPSGLPNLVWSSASWGPPLWIAGATAAAHAPDDPVCFVSAYEFGSLSSPEAANAFILGVRAVNTTKPVMLMTMNNWYWPGAEELAVSLLNKNGCKAVARFTDARLIDIWVNTHPESGMVSIGAHSDVGAYVGDTVVMSALEDNTGYIALFEKYIASGHIGFGFYPLVQPIIYTSLSPVAALAGHASYAWAVKNGPDADHIICGPKTLHSGATVSYTQSNGCLTVLERPEEYIYDSLTTYYTFSNGLDCPNGTYYEYSFPDLALTCHACPPNTYRPPEQKAAGTSCTPCPSGFTSGAGATICTQSHDAVAEAWYAFLIAGLVVFGALAVAGVRQYRAWALVAVRPMDPEAAFAVCFIGLKNEYELQELGEANVAAAYEKWNAIVRAAAREHGCFEARRIDAGTVMVVSKKAAGAVLFAESVMESAVTRVDWRGAVLVHQVVNSGVHAARSARHGRLRRHSKESMSSHASRHSKAQSERSKRSQALSIKLAKGQDQERTTDTDTPSTTRRSATIDLSTIVPTMYAGLHFGASQIEVDEEQQTVSYHGRTLDVAAGIADAAVSGQILMSVEMAEALDLEHTSRRPEGKFVTSGKRMETTVVTYQSPRIPEEHHRAVAKAAARVSENMEEGVLVNALAKAEGRLMRRRVAVLSCHVPQLAGDFRVDERSAVHAQDIIEEIADAAADNFGEIHAVQDGIVFVTVGVLRPVSLLPTRAAGIAHRIEHLCSAIGMHVGPAVVGRSAKGSCTVLGRIASAATVMRLIAAENDTKIVCSGASYAGLFPSHHLATIDALALPWEASMKCTRVVSVCGLRELGQAEEWLYSFERESVLEAAWSHLIDGKDILQTEIDAIENAPTTFEPDDGAEDPSQPHSHPSLVLSKKALLQLLQDTSTSERSQIFALQQRLRERTEVRLASIAARALAQSLPAL